MFIYLNNCYKLQVVDIECEIVSDIFMKQFGNFLLRHIFWEAAMGRGSYSVLVAGTIHILGGGIAIGQHKTQEL